VEEVYVVVQTTANPPRGLIIAVCASKERAEQYVTKEGAGARNLLVRVEPVLNRRLAGQRPRRPRAA
jgi:hypothetical protein